MKLENQTSPMSWWLSSATVTKLFLAKSILNRLIKDFEKSLRHMRLKILFTGSFSDILLKLFPHNSLLRIQCQLNVLNFSKPGCPLHDLLVEFTRKLRSPISPYRLMCLLDMKNETSDMFLFISSWMACLRMQGTDLVTDSTEHSIVKAFSLYFITQLPNRFRKLVFERTGAGMK